MMYANCCDCGAGFSRDPGETWKVRCLACWALRKAKREPRLIPSSIDDPLRAELREHLRGLLMLAHPDRHGGSALATKATQWLLSVRDRLELKESVL